MNISFFGLLVSYGKDLIMHRRFVERGFTGEGGAWGGTVD